MIDENKAEGCAGLFFVFVFLIGLMCLGLGVWAFIEIVNWVTSK